MSKHCRISRLPGIHSKPICELSPDFLEMTSTPGALRCHTDPSRAQGLNFICPGCPDEKRHGVTLLFDVRGVPEAAKPPGRYHMDGLLPLRHVTIEGIVKSPYCNWQGTIRNGIVRW